MIPRVDLAVQVLGRDDISVRKYPDDTYKVFIEENGDETEVTGQQWIDIQAAWSAYVPPTPQEEDEQALNELLIQEGSVLRGITELLFEDRNNMAQAVADATDLASFKANFPPVYTFDQFKTALKNKMRS